MFNDSVQYHNSSNKRCKEILVNPKHELTIFKIPKYICLNNNNTFYDKLPVTMKKSYIKKDIKNFN